VVRGFVELTLGHAHEQQRATDWPQLPQGCGDDEVKEKRMEGGHRAEEEGEEDDEEGEEYRIEQVDDKGEGLREEDEEVEHRCTVSRMGRSTGRRSELGRGRRGRRSTGRRSELGRGRRGRRSTGRRSELGRGRTTGMSIGRRKGSEMRLRSSVVAGAARVAAVRSTLIPPTG
jgi:hypothetical protein